MSELDRIDVLRWPLIGRLLRFRHARTLFQLPVLLFSIAMVLHGLLGPSLSAKNLATTFTWIHFRGVLVFVLLCAGNFFCFSCPFVLVRDFARRFHQPKLNWPRWLRSKWVATLLFAGVLFAYEAGSLWASPLWTSLLIIAYFLAILSVDLVFKHAAFCKYVCPIGQFNFLASTISPLEVAVRSQSTCNRCATRDCIRGTRPSVHSPVQTQRGCELALFQPLKTGNMDCTFCLDCVQACPHDNIGILSRLPAEELAEDPPRSGIGRFSRRFDIAALIVVFTFGALMNTFGMVSPVYRLESWLSATFHLRNQTAILAILFFAVLVVAPAILLSLAAFASRKWARLPLSSLSVITRYSYALVPLGFGMWLAHYGFHFLTGLYTVVPLLQNAAINLTGQALLGAPNWLLVGLPSRFVQPLEYGFLLLGLAGSFALTRHFAGEDAPQQWLKAFLPWALISLAIFAAGLWLIGQPMDMRATFLS